MRLVLTDRLYAGNFSVVHKGRFADRPADPELVVKRCCDNRHARREFNAIRALSERKCRNIIELEVDRLVGDQEIANCGDKHKFYTQIYDHPSNIVSALYERVPDLCADDAAVAQVARDVLVGLSDIHACGFTHCDLKRENVMFDGATYRLIDFGLAMDEDSARQNTFVRGTPFYLAPEIVQHGEITPMVDMYALGVLIYSLLHKGQHPIDELNYTTGAKMCQHVIANSAYDPKRWANAAAPVAADLCAILLRKYPVARASAAEALGHGLFETG